MLAKGPFVCHIELQLKGHVQRGYEEAAHCQGHDENVGHTSHLFVGDDDDDDDDVSH